MKQRSLKIDLAEPRSARPKYKRLKDHLIREMVSGRLKPGEALPSEQRLGEQLGIAPMTVRHAMASLETDGLIRRVPRQGSFVEEDARGKLKQGLDIFALVVPDTRGGFYPSLLHGFEDAAGDLQHQTIICNTDNQVAEQGNIVLQLLDKKVGGVAMVPTTDTTMSAFQVRQLQEHGIPVVFCHRRIEGVAAPLLAIPFREVARMAGRTLTEHGHRRVAFLLGLRSSTTVEYEAGLKEGLRAGGCDVPPETIYVSKSIALREEEVWAELEKVFAKPDPPTAIFASFDSLAEMVYVLLPKLGLRVPEDVSLISEGGAWREGAIIRRLTSVVIDEVGTGKKAVSLLHEMRRGERAIDDNEEFVLQLSLSEGETLMPPAGTTR